MFVAAVSSRPTSSGLRTTGRRRGSRVEMSSSARSWRFSVILKKNRSAVALTLAVPTDVPIEPAKLIAMDIPGGGLVGRPAQEIGKLFDVADILVVRLGAEPADRHVLDQSPA